MKLKAGQQRIRCFVANDRDKLERFVNDWLDGLRDAVTVEKIQFQYTPNCFTSFIVLILYRIEGEANDK